MSKLLIAMVASLCVSNVAWAQGWMDFDGPPGPPQINGTIAGEFASRRAVGRGEVGRSGALGGLDHGNTVGESARAGTRGEEASDRGEGAGAAGGPGGGE